MIDDPTTTTITLTRQELTDIRVSILIRLDLLSPTRNGDDADARVRYERIRALMDTDGPLYTALFAFKGVPDVAR